MFWMKDVREDKTGPTCSGDVHVSMFEGYRQSLVTKTDPFPRGA